MMLALNFESPGVHGRRRLRCTTGNVIPRSAAITFPTLLIHVPRYFFEGGWVSSRCTYVLLNATLYTSW